MGPPADVAGGPIFLTVYDAAAELRWARLSVAAFFLKGAVKYLARLGLVAPSASRKC